MELIVSLHRHLELNGRFVLFLQDAIFSTLWYNLDIQMKQNTKAGVGLTTNQAGAITNEQEDQLWPKKVFWVLKHLLHSLKLDSSWWKFILDFRVGMSIVP